MANDYHPETNQGAVFKIIMCRSGTFTGEYHLIQYQACYSCQLSDALVEIRLPMVNTQPHMATNKIFSEMAHAITVGNQIIL